MQYGPNTKAAHGKRWNHVYQCVCLFTTKTHLWSHRLTAYVAKVFSMANSLVAVRREQICNAIKYLILKTQEPSGQFLEHGRMYHTEMIVSALFFSFSIVPTQQWTPRGCNRHVEPLSFFRVTWPALIQMSPWQPSVWSPCRSRVHCAQHLWLWVLHIFGLFVCLVGCFSFLSGWSPILVNCITSNYAVCSFWRKICQHLDSFQMAFLASRNGSNTNFWHNEIRHLLTEWHQLQVHVHGVFLLILTSDGAWYTDMLLHFHVSWSLCFPSIQSLPASTAKAVGFLEQRLPFVGNPYAVAIASYALANVNKFNRGVLYQHVHPGDLTVPDSCA